MNKKETQLKENNEILELQDSELDALHKKNKDMESRLVSQEQFSRRISLRFHNNQVPFNRHEKILHYFNTDSLNRSINDTSRSHVIGKAKHGKCQVII